MRAELGDGAKFMAGGQSLLAMMRQGLFEPDAIISLKRVPELKTIVLRPDGSLFIGSMATHQQIAEHPVISEHAELLSQTARRVASTQVRNLGTWGGNVSHGEPGADPPASLIACDAAVELRSLEGTRVVPIAEFFLDYLTTDIQEGEIVSGLIVPAQPKDARWVYYKHTIRDDGDLAVCGIAVRLTVDSETAEIRDVRVGINGASITPVYVEGVGRALQGRRVSEALLAQAGEMAASACQPIDDAEASASYRLAVVERLVRKGLRQLALA